MKLKHAAVGLALAVAPATVAAHQCSSKQINKGKISSSFKLDFNAKKKLRSVKIYLPADNAKKIIEMSVPAPLVEAVRKDKDEKLKGVFYANATIAAAKSGKGRPGAWKCAEEPMKLPMEETEAGEEPEAAPKPTTAPKSPDLNKSKSGILDILGTGKNEPKPGVPAPAKAEAKKGPFAKLSARDWDDVRKKRGWASLDVMEKPSKSLAIKNDGNPWEYRDLKLLGVKMKTFVNDAFNNMIKTRPYAPDGSLKVRLEINREGNVKAVKFQGPAVSPELAEWLFNFFKRIVFTPGDWKSPEFDYVLKKPQ